MVKGPVIRMQTGNLLRDDISHDYAGSVRLWGLVNGNLMWDWEVADAEGKLHKHASAELRKTSSMTGDSLGTSMFGSLDGEEPPASPAPSPPPITNLLSAPLIGGADSLRERCTFRD